jgi:hypothetical protein
MENHLVGLPEYGVTLSGSPENSVIENRSGKTVIAYVLKTADQDGRGPVHGILLATSGQPAGIPNGGAIYFHGNVPVNLAGKMQRTFHSTSIRQGPVVTATLQNVVFADGQFVGVDAHGAFESFGLRIKAIAEVGLLGKTGVWDQLEALALSPGSRLGPTPSGVDPRTYFERRSTATLLVHERKFNGDDAAARLGEIYASLPLRLWK